MIHNEEAVNALERVAAEERGVAAERGALAADLTETRDRMAVEANAIGGMVEWWKARYPGTPAALELDKAHEWAVGQLADANARIAEVAKEQQAHEVAAAALTEDAARARAEWEAEHGKKVATGDRATKAHPAVERSEADLNNQGRPVEWIGRTGADPGVLVCAVPSPPGSNKGAFGHGGRLICGARLADGPCDRHEPGPADRMVEALTNPPAGPQLPNGVAPIDPRSAEATAVDGASE